jgi:hypothetical protein
MTIDIAYKPTEKQAMYHRSKAYELLYGGAAGGGKSKATVMEALIDSLEHPGIDSYLFRRTYPELRDTLIREALASIPKEIGSYTQSSHDLKLVNGSVLHFRYCRNLQDAYNYQGTEMHRLYIDELTHFTQEVYDYLRTRMRAPKSRQISPRIRCTSNPGGVGHGWVKSAFIDGKEPYQIHKVSIASQMLGKTVTVTRQYIPATAKDNPHLGENYIIELEQKPEALRKALLLGDWNVFEGQVFTEFVNDPKHYKDRIGTHVIDPFKIPSDWRRFRTFDWGYSRPFSVGYWAEDKDGRLYRYAEIYGSPKNRETGLTDKANIGMRLEPAAVSKLIREYEDLYEKGNRIIGIADPAIFDESRGSDGCVAKIFERDGIYFEKGDHERVAGKLQLHNRLAFDENGIPMIYIFNTCKDFIRTLPTLVYDPIHVEDIDSDCEDHIYDETRYLCMYLPIMPPKQPAKKLIGDVEDPLNMLKRDIITTPYDFMI